jgi:hypothetical protein
VNVSQLDDPDGNGGQKPLGLGAAMQAWVRTWRDRRAEESGKAQSEALWSLEPRATKIITRLRIPFRFCFVE